MDSELCDMMRQQGKDICNLQNSLQAMKDQYLSLFQKNQNLEVRVEYLENKIKEIRENSDISMKNNNGNNSPNSITSGLTTGGNDSGTINSMIPLGNLNSDDGMKDSTTGSNKIELPSLQTNPSLLDKNLSKSQNNNNSLFDQSLV